jgi:hypothetical protein
VSALGLAAARQQQRRSGRLLQLTFDQGRRDALSWCEEQGMIKRAL